MNKIPPESDAGKYLRDRGIDLGFAVAYGAIWTKDENEIWERLGLPEPSEDTEPFRRFTNKELLSFPLHGGGGYFSKLFPVELGKKDKGFRAPWRYKQPIFIPKETWEAKGDSGQPLFVTEGPVKATALSQAGLLAIGLIGTWMSERDGWYRPLARVFKAFEWRNREVFLVLDADQNGKTRVRQSAIRNSLLLAPLGARVFQLGWSLEEGKGIDDYLVGKDAAQELARLIEEAKKVDLVSQFSSDADMTLVRKELHRTIRDELWFSKLTRAFAKQFKVKVSSFGKYWQEKRLDEEVERSTVIVPPANKPCDYPVVPSEVLEKIRTTLLRFVWMKPSQSRTITLHIVLHSLHDVVDKLPILLITSPEEDCGKSTSLKLIKFLSNRPVIASNISPAAMYRFVEKECPTLLLDEADTYLNDNEALRGIIDSGHDREDAIVIRSDDKGNLFAFRTWCPKVIAMIGLPKRTILSRSIPIRMEKKPEEVKLEKLRKKHFAELEELRREIATLADDIREPVRTFEADLLSNRAGDNWEPLLAIAYQAGEDWKKLTISAALNIHKQGKADKRDFNHEALVAVGKFFAQRRTAQKLSEKERFFCRTDDILSASEGINSKACEESLWYDEPNKLTAQKLGEALRAYGISSDVQRVIEHLSGKRKQARGYWSDAIEKVVKKYV